MKKQIISKLFIAKTVALLSVFAALTQPKGPSVTIKGEVVDLWCYLEGGDHGASHKQCSTTCARAGNPIGLVDTKGNVYVTAGIQDHQPGRDVLIDKMNEEVTVTGVLVKKGGTQMIFVKSVK